MMGAGCAEAPHHPSRFPHIWISDPQAGIILPPRPEGKRQRIVLPGEGEPLQCMPVGVGAYRTNRPHASAPSYPTSGLVAEWQFSTGGLLTDTSGNSRNLSQTGSVSQVPGIVGQAASFPNALGNYLYIADGSWLNFAASGFTCAFWVHNTSGAYQATVYKWGTTATEWAVLLDPSNVPTFYQNSGGSTSVTGDAVSSGTTTLIVVGFDGSKAYIQNNNGTLHQVTTSALTHTSQRLVLGENEVGLYPLNGWLDQVRIYSRWLNSTERGQLYNSGAGV